MNKNLLAAAKLQKAMSGLKTAYRDASPTDRRVIVATMKEVQAIHAQLVTAAEEEEEDEIGELESEEDESAPDLSMDEMAEGEDGEEPASMEDDESMSMDEAHMSEDDMMDESDIPVGESLPALDFGDDMDEESMSDGMGEESMGEESMDEESGFGGTVELDGLEIPEEYLSDLGDLGLLDLGSEGEDSEGMESEDFEAGEQEEGDEDEELAVAALALAASALRAMKVSADERESSQEEDPEAEADEEGIFHEGKVLDEEEIDALQSAGLTASAKKNDDVSVKLREISARLSKIRAPVKASNETVVSREKLEEMGASSDSILDQAPYTIKLLKASEDVRSAENGLRVSLGYRSEDSSDGPHGGQIYGIYRASGRIKLIAEVKNGKCVELRGAMNRLPSDEEKLIAKAVWNSVPTSASVKASARNREAPRPLAPRARASR